MGLLQYSWPEHGWRRRRLPVPLHEPEQELHDLCWVLERVRGARLLGALGHQDPHALAPLPQHLLKVTISQAQIKKGLYVHQLVDFSNLAGRNIYGRYVARTLKASSSVRSSPMYTGRTSLQSAKPGINGGECHPSISLFKCFLFVDCYYLIIQTVV